jgi:hypothetical protein
LGAPGSGKTTELLGLANDLLLRATRDQDHPIPVVFPLSTWAESRKPIQEWLRNELNLRYGVPKTIAQRWIDSDQVIPLLDGLDEVIPQERSKCIEAINFFRQSHGLIPLVITSRTSDYNVLRKPLRLHGAVVLQPITREQVNCYLCAIGPPGEPVRAALHADPSLWELLDSPLLLNVVTVACVGSKSGPSLIGGSADDSRNYMFKLYVDHMLGRRAVERRYTYEQSIRYLSWLAYQMNRDGTTIYDPEQPRFDWLSESQQRIIMRCWIIFTTCGFTVLGGLGFGLHGAGIVAGLIAGFVAGWLAMVFALLVRLVFLPGVNEPYSCGEAVARAVARCMDEADLFFNVFAPLAGLLLFLVVVEISILSFVALGGVLAALIGGLVIGLAARLIAGLVADLPSLFTGDGGFLRRHIRGTAMVSALVGFGSAVSFEVFGANLAGLAGRLLAGLITGLLAGLIIGLVQDLLFFFGEGRTYVRSRIVRNGLTATIGGLVGGLLAMLLIGYTCGPDHGLPAGLLGGLAGSFVGGGDAFVIHFIVRLFLIRKGVTPMRYVKFLDYAADRILLNKPYGSYMFIHRMFLDYFASLYEKQLAAGAPGNESSSSVI